MRAIDISRAVAIEGWMEIPELTWLAERAASCKLIAEVGCWRGRSTRALADHLPLGGVLYAIDTWLGSEEHQNQFEGKSPDWVFTTFLDNLCDHDDTCIVRPLRMNSTAAAKLLGRNNRKFDLIFLDAAHDYDNVKADIAAWTPLVRVGGIICGHDHGYEPVYRAVHEAFDNVVNVPNTSIWMVNL